MDRDDQDPTAWEDINPGTASGGQGPALPSTCSAEPTPSLPRNVPAEVKRLIAEVGLRYRPSAQADLEEHAASLALLATDVADIPPSILREAIRRHVAQSVFMPKAAELLSLAQTILTSRDGAGKPVDMAARRNAQLRAEGNFAIEWYYDENDQIALRSTRPTSPGLGRRIP